MPISGLLVASGNAPEVRPLSSTGVTRHQRSYEPVRHPTRPSLLLMEFWMRATTSHRTGFPCSPLFPVDMLSPTTPAKQNELVVRKCSGRDGDDNDVFSESGFRRPW